MKTFFERAAFAIAGILFAIAIPAAAATIYGAGTLLQPGDVNTTHILNNTILNADVNTLAAISASKIAGGGTAGNVMLSNNTQLTTSTNLKFATSTNDFYVLTGRIHATSTNFRGVNYTWPAADGTNGQALTTNGSGTLLFANPAASFTASNFTTGETINTGDAVVMASTTQNKTLFTSGANGAAAGFGFTGEEQKAQSTTETSVYCFNALTVRISKTGAPTDNLVVGIQANNAGVPSNTYLASGSVTGASLTTSLVSTTVPMNQTFCTTANTQFWIVWSRSGSLSGTNLFNADRGATNNYANGLPFNLNAGSWTQNGAEDFVFSYVLQSSPGLVYQTTVAHSGYYENFIGFAQATTTLGGTVSVITSGAATGLLGVVAGHSYFLSNTAGRVATTPGTNSRKVGIGMATTTVVVTNIW